jgi:hypothetical protein
MSLGASSVMNWKINLLFVELFITELLVAAVALRLEPLVMLPFETYEEPVVIRVLLQEKQNISHLTYELRMSIE